MPDATIEQRNRYNVLRSKLVHQLKELEKDCGKLDTTTNLDAANLIIKTMAKSYRYYATLSYYANKDLWADKDFEDLMLALNITLEKIVLPPNTGTELPTELQTAWTDSAYSADIAKELVLYFNKYLAGPYESETKLHQLEIAACLKITLDPALIKKTKMEATPAPATPQQEIVRTETTPAPATPQQTIVPTEVNNNNSPLLIYLMKQQYSKQKTQTKEEEKPQTKEEEKPQKRRLTFLSRGSKNKG